MEEEDRISNLPDSILSHILSFLSTKEAVGTSILSTRWKYHFASVTSFNFELDLCELNTFELDPCELDKKVWLYDTKREQRLVKSLMSLLNRVLRFHKTTSIGKLGLKLHRGPYCSTIDSSHVYKCLCSTLRRAVQHLDLDIDIGRRFTLPTILFTCGTLVTLKLDVYNLILNVPNDVCFPNLKTLHLNFIEFPDDDSIRRLFSSCINLEDMVIYRCCMRNEMELNISNPLLKRLTISRSYGSDYWIVIDAPMLVHLKCVDRLAQVYSLENSQSLVSAEIDIDLGGHNGQADVTPIFRGIHEVQSLNLSIYSLKLLLSCEPVPTFRNVVRLEISRPLSEFSNDSYWETGLGGLLGGFPEIEELVLYQGDIVWYRQVSSYLPEEVPFCLCFNLKAIELYDFKPRELSIKIALYFLKTGGVLEKFTIRTDPCVGEEEKLKIKEELLSSPRKSEQCCILIV